MIFVQALGFIPSFISIYSLQFNDRKKIVLLQIGCGLMWAAHYYFLGAYTGVLINMVGMVRAILSYFNDRPWAKEKGVYSLILGLVALSVALSWDGFVSILPAASMVCTTTALWIHNMKRTRLLFLVSSPCLLAYDILTGSWGCAIIETVAFFSFIVSILRFDVFGKKKEELK